MEITIYKPQSPLLKEYIECFYILNRNEDDAPSTYLTFPGLQQMVSLYANTSSEITTDTVYIRHEPNGILESRIVGKFNKVVCVRYEGKIHEITTLFKPLAINTFLPSPLKNFAPDHFPAFNPYPDFMPVMLNIYKTVATSEKLRLLEDYWLSKIQDFKHPFMPSVIEYLCQDELDELSLSEICKLHKISRQTMHQHFERYLCKTPSLFRKIVRFRKAMSSYSREAAQHEFSQLSALANYFDQSHMIKDFKALTGYTPKSFFQRISRLGNGEVNLLFLDK